jgi:hypothetical protein
MPDFLAEVLHKPHNRRYLLAVRAAREWKVPPRTMINGDQPDVWTREDVLLANALVVLENETCKECGTPAWLGHSTDNRLLFKTDSAHCYGCEELEKEREKLSKDKSYKGYGETVYPVPYMFGGKDPLPSRRESYERRGQ